jgi:hypothetical protein
VNPDWHDNSRAARAAKLTLNTLLMLCISLGGLSVFAALWGGEGRHWLSRDLSEFLGPCMVLFVLCGSVPFGLWLYRTNRQLEQVGHKPTLPAAFSLIGWFLPFANLIIPCLCMQDALDGMHKQHLLKVNRKGQRKPKWPIIWEVLWVLGLPLLVLQETLIADGGDGAMIGLVMQPLACAVAAAAIALLRALVGRVSRLDAELLERQLAQAAPAEPGRDAPPF